MPTKGDERYHAAMNRQDTSTDPLTEDERHAATCSRKPYVKPTQEELAERVSFVNDMLVEGRSKGEIIKTVKARYDVSTRSVESYLARARDANLKATDKTREEWRAEQLKKYLDISNNPEVQDRDRLKALERIDKIIGLEQHAPYNVQLTGKDGGPIQQQVATVNVDLSAKLREYADAIRSAAIANVQEQANVLGLPAPGQKETQR